MYNSNQGYVQRLLILEQKYTYIKKLYLAEGKSREVLQMDKCANLSDYQHFMPLPLHETSCMYVRQCLSWKTLQDELAAGQRQRNHTHTSYP